MKALASQAEPQASQAEDRVAENGIFCNNNVAYNPVNASRRPDHITRHRTTEHELMMAV